MLRKTTGNNESLLFSCPSPVVCLQSRNVPIQILLRKKRRQTFSAERGKEHCVPPGGLVVGSYVRRLSAWQQSRAPTDSVILLINTHQLEVCPRGCLCVCVCVHVVSVLESWKICEVIPIKNIKAAL